jgi:hypothetical protein
MRRDSSVSSVSWKSNPETELFLESVFILFAGVSLCLYVCIFMNTFLLSLSLCLSVSLSLCLSVSLSLCLSVSLSLCLSVSLSLCLSVSLSLFISFSLFLYCFISSTLCLSLRENCLTFFLFLLGNVYPEWLSIRIPHKSAAPTRTTTTVVIWLFSSER